MTTKHNFEDIDDMSDFFLALIDSQLVLLENKKRKKGLNTENLVKIHDNKTEQSFMPLTNEASHSYETLLNHLTVMIGGDMDTQTKLSITPAQVSRFGVKKTVFANFPEICASFNRDKTHVNNYLMSELGTTTSEDAKGRLLLKGKYNQKNIHKILEKYILTYVQCSMCKSLNTEVSKNAANRLYFLECINCGCSKSVASVIKSFHATTRQDRIESRK